MFCYQYSEHKIKKLAISTLQTTPSLCMLRMSCTYKLQIHLMLVIPITDCVALLVNNLI